MENIGTTSAVGEQRGNSKKKETEMGKMRGKWDGTLRFHSSIFPVVVPRVEDLSHSSIYEEISTVHSVTGKWESLPLTNRGGVRGVLRHPQDH